MTDTVRIRNPSGCKVKPATTFVLHSLSTAQTHRRMAPGHLSPDLQQPKHHRNHDCRFRGAMRMLVVRLCVIIRRLIVRIDLSCHPMVSIRTRNFLEFVGTELHRECSPCQSCIGPSVLIPAQSLRVVQFRIFADPNTTNNRQGSNRSVPCVP